MKKDYTRDYATEMIRTYAASGFSSYELAKETVLGYTAWRIDGTLREFPKIKTMNVWFKYPAHYPDNTGSLKDLGADSYNRKKSPYKQNFSNKKSPEEKKQERIDGFDTAFNVLAVNEKTTIEDIVSYTGTSEKTVKRRIQESGKYWTDGKIIGLK